VSGRSRTVSRGAVALIVLALAYGIVAEAGGPILPRRIWVGAHYIEDVELIPRYASLSEEAVFLVRSGILQGGITVSGLRVLGGFLLGALVGVTLGGTMAWATRFGYLLEPWVVLFRFTPALALLPLYVLWFGLGEASKILLIATGVAIVTLHGAFEGVRGIPRVYLDSAASLGAPRHAVLRGIVLPAALPHVLSSFRIAGALAWVTIVVAELIKPTMPSLGYLLALSGAYPRIPTLVVALATIGVLVLISDALAVAAYQRATGWMRRRNG
jgi:sulfonate transport system permease protein